MFSERKNNFKNCAIEPEIKDLTNFLNSAGAKKLDGQGDYVKLKVWTLLKKTEYSAMSDRIEAATFCVAATIAKGNLKIKNVNSKLINTELALLKKAGAKLKLLMIRFLLKTGKN